MNDPKDVMEAGAAGEPEGKAEVEQLEAATTEAAELEAVEVEEAAEDAAEEVAEAAETAEEATEAVEDAAEGAAEAIEPVEADVQAEASEEDAAEVEALVDGEPTDADDENVESVVASAIPAEKPAPKPKSSNGIGDLIAVGILSLLMGVIMVYIMAVAMPSGSGDNDLSGGVAATVDGVAIGENQITEYVAQLRKSQSVEDDNSWGEWLVGNGLTAETLRSALINQFVDQELVKIAIKEQDIKVSSEDVDNYINQIAEQQGGEEALVKALADQGATMDDFRKNVEMGLSEQVLAEKIAGEVEVADDEVIEYLKMYGIVESDATTLDGVDESMVQSFRDQVKNQKIGEKYSQWMSERQQKAKVEINDMPEGLPYAIDVTPFEEAAKAEAAATAQDGSMVDDAEADIEVEDAQASAESAEK